MTENEKFEQLTRGRVEPLILKLAAPTIISMLISTTAPFIPGLLENRIAFDAVSLFALSLIVLFMILLSIKVKKQPWHGILCFFTICIGVLFYIIFIGYTALWDYLL